MQDFNHEPYGVPDLQKPRLRCLSFGKIETWSLILPPAGQHISVKGPSTPIHSGLRVCTDGLRGLGDQAILGCRALGLGFEMQGSGFRGFGTGPARMRSGILTKRFWDAWSSCCAQL